MSELGRVQLDLLLLATVRSRPSHGYAIIEAIRRTSDGEFDIPESAMYPALHRLEHEGLVSSEWSEVGGRRRRIYRITRRGRKALGERQQAWQRTVRGVGGVLGEVY